MAAVGRRGVRARRARENKPIFLSIGYSTCHWCHVMAHESFENEKTASILNEHFVSIKVDREERPDVDRVYMTFVQATTGSGGWPLSVWLTPELKPFFGGTYFPPEDRHGRKGFPEILLARRRRHGASSGRRLSNKAKSWSTPCASTRPALRPEPARPASRRSGFAARHRRTVLEFRSGMGRLRRGAEVSAPGDSPFSGPRRGCAGIECRDAASGRCCMLGTTLRKMAMGGMHDHIGGGFHRYSVDRTWHVPHFEKMLYDQGQLAIAYLEGFQLTGEKVVRGGGARHPRVRRARSISPGGAFFSAEDADSALDHGETAHAEGAFYVWTKAEIESLLTPEDAPIFCRHYGVDTKGNADPRSDPHNEFEGKNILIERCPPTQTSSEFNLPIERVNAILADSRAKLFAARATRPRPHLDDKILTGWNGLMISAFARGRPNS